MVSKAQLKAQAKYDKANTRSILLKLNRINDADILSKLDDTENRQGYIKRLLRDDIRGEGDVLSIDSIRYMVQPIGRRYAIDRIFLFGSYARGEATTQSDVDLLIEGGAIDTMESYLQLEGELKNALGKGVDLVMGEPLQASATRRDKRFMQHFDRDKVLIYG